MVASRSAHSAPPAPHCRATERRPGPWGCRPRSGRPRWRAGCGPPPSPRRSAPRPHRPSSRSAEPHAGPRAWPRALHACAADEPALKLREVAMTLTMASPIGVVGSAGQSSARSAHPWRCAVVMMPAKSTTLRDRRSIFAAMSPSASPAPRRSSADRSPGGACPCRSSQRGDELHRPPAALSLRVDGGDLCVKAGAGVGLFGGGDTEVGKEVHAVNLTGEQQTNVWCSPPRSHPDSRVEKSATVRGRTRHLPAVLPHVERLGLSQRVTRP